MAGFTYGPLLGLFAYGIFSKKTIKDNTKAEEDRHWMIPDNNHIMSLIDDNFLPYVSPTQEQLDLESAKIIRMQRDFLLVSEVDPIITNILRWEDMDTQKQNEWQQYRQELLDVPTQEGFPDNVVWPTKIEHS